jgi:hypothetical protein
MNLERTHSRSLLLAGLAAAWAMTAAAAMQKSRNPRGNIGIYNHWPQSTCSQREPTVYRLTDPGPEGAVPNLRFEALREGLQESEALIVAAEASKKTGGK